jgi:aminopeptidase N
MKFSKTILITLWYLLLANTTFAYTRQDTLRGSNGAGRNWWDVQRYELDITFDTVNKSIRGYNDITINVTAKPSAVLQIDLQEPMLVDSIVQGSNQLKYTREGNVYWVTGVDSWQGNVTFRVYYHGSPRIAKMPPWEGGFIWTKDSTGKPWIAVACQGLGASSWWPCKDYQGDEPDNGMDVLITFPGNSTVVGNGEPIAAAVTEKQNDGYTWGWRVTNPINTYDATFYIGDYISWEDTLMGEKGKLNLSYYAVRHNEQKARRQFAVVKQMLHCFEYWMGPYPFYEDGYKLVEAPYLGMEHQSAVAYGNEYKMGYLGSDRSSTGVGLLFDFIIVHESGHEWFGNNITAVDIADNWLHEGFTTYTEVLFAECAFGKEKAFAYCRGEWKNIRNDVPITGVYGVHDDGSSDKYDKGSAVVHMLRMMINNDEKFRQLLRGLNKDFYHKTVTSKVVEAYIEKFTGLELKAFFEQYLHTTNIPQLEWYIKKKQLYYRFTNVVAGFTLPLEVKSGNRKASVKPTTEWQNIPWKRGGFNLSVSEDFLIGVKP